MYLLALLSFVLAIIAAAASFARIRRRRWLTDRRPKQALDIVMLHPDLGLGGAERLVVDAAVALSKLRGHRVRLYTNFHDPHRAFSETIDGTIDVFVVAAWIPRSFSGRGHVFFASLRMAVASAYLCLWAEPADCYIVDQVAAAMPVVRFLTDAPILFYCHFPDQLCDPNRQASSTGAQRPSRSLTSIPRRVYRLFFDRLEGLTMRSATRVVCNSKFSRDVTVHTFPFLRTKIDEERDVLYPPINVTLLTQPPDTTAPQASEVLRWIGGRLVVLSINRFERKKNLRLAVEAFSLLLNNGSNPDGVALIVAGGYDPRLSENVEYYAELAALALEKSIPPHQILFLRSISDDLKRLLLSSCAVVVYTPSGEHFGIVPLEAMAWGKPVVAVADGGPLESITTARQVGILVGPTPQEFAGALRELLCEPGSAALRREMGDAAKARANNTFGLPTFAERLDAQIHACVRQCK